MLVLFLILIIFPSTCILIILLHKHRKNKSRLPPGPSGLPFIGNLHQLNATTPHIHLWQLSKKYGPLMYMKLGSVPLIIVSSPDMAKQIFKTHDLSFSSRPKVVGRHKLSYNGSDVAFAPYSDSWRELRKICVVHLLSNKQVQSFRPIREEEVSSMIKNLSVSASLGDVTNLSSMMLSLMGTLICRTAFGKVLDEDGSRRTRFDKLTIESQALLAAIFVSDYIPWFGWVDKLSGINGSLEKVSKALDEFFIELIDEHLDPSWVVPTNPNILDILIKLKEEQSCSIDLTWDNIKAILMDIFIAGTDTAAAAITWTMTALIKDPTSMKKLQSEIRELVGERGEVSEDDLPKLPYLKAVIKEGLRLYPPAPLLGPRETLESCTLQGYTIPAKTSVYINAWAIARDPDYWESPNEFKPERFLNAGIDIPGKDFEVIPFGAGRRGCPGMSMGLAMVEQALANLLYSFDWQLPPGMSKEDIDTEAFPGLTMHKKNPLCLVPISKYP